MAIIRFLVDQNVQMAVARWLTAKGYEVLHVRDILAADSPDKLIAFVANEAGLIVVTHDKHFRKIAELLPEGTRNRFVAGSGRITLRVNEAHAVRRLESEWDAFLFYYDRAVQRGTRCLITITNTTVSAITQSENQEQPDGDTD